jgi:excinuclease ABC subunit C
MSFAKRIFRIRDCKRRLPLPKPGRPCLNHSIGRCFGVCAGTVDPATYRRNVEYLCGFLKGRRNHILTELEQRMAAASEALDFEQAALLRDQIGLIRDASKMQRVDLAVPDGSYDVFGVHVAPRTVSLAVLHFREGLLIGKRHFLVHRNTWELSESARDAAVAGFYQDSPDDLPHEVLLPEASGFGPEALQEWFRAHCDTTVRVYAPRRGTKRKLVALAEKNAELHLAQRTPGRDVEALAELQTALSLPALPRTIEAFDISNLGESFAVAGMVHFEEGAPRKSMYRRYKIASVSGQDDFAMLMEVVGRRLSRLRNEGKPFPSLLLIDGGKGQLGAARKALAGYENPPMLAALAKKEDVLFSPWCPEGVRLDERHPARRLVERVRDEVHRFAVTYHRSLRGKQFRRSSLESFPGIGPKRAVVLLRTFGSLKQLRKASEEEIAAVKGMSPAAAARLKQLLRDT